MPLLDFIKKISKKNTSKAEKTSKTIDAATTQDDTVIPEKKPPIRPIVAAPTKAKEFKDKTLKTISDSKSGTDKKSKQQRRYNKPVTQVAQDVRDNKEATLVFEELRWHSGGVFSNVYRGKLVQPDIMEVAIKKTWPKESVRSDEMIILAGMRRASPRNIIKLLYRFKNTATDGTICEAFVFEYMPETLDKVIKGGLHPVDVKVYIWQLFNGLDFLANNRIAHRDIKPVNILVNRETGELQIGDFGSAKVIGSRDRSSSYQVTRYYRPPEMLLGSTHYNHLIDVWSAGCVLGEMIKGRVLFRGQDSEHQLQLVLAALGPPTPADIAAMKISRPSKLPSVTKTGILSALRIRSESFLPSETQGAIVLLHRILVYNPELRLCGKAFLDEPFFDDIIKGTKLRPNGKKAELIRQSEDTLGMHCFERSERSSERVVPSAVEKPEQPEEADEEASKR